MSGPPIYVINRAADDARIAASAESLGLGFTRIEAMDAHDPESPFFLFEHSLPQPFWGGEARKVLKGLRKTIRHARPVLVVAVSVEWSAKAAPLLARLGHVEAERAESGLRRRALFRPGAEPGA